MKRISLIDCSFYKGNQVVIKELSFALLPAISKEFMILVLHFHKNISDKVDIYEYLTICFLTILYKEFDSDDFN